MSSQGCSHSMSTEGSGFHSLDRWDSSLGKGTFRPEHGPRSAVILCCPALPSQPVPGARTLPLRFLMGLLQLIR